MASQQLPPRSASVTLGSDGTGECSIFPPGMSWGISATRVTGGVSTSSTRVPIAELTICGRPFEGSQTGNNDSSDSYYVLNPGDYVTCRWSGGDAGARATLTISGWQYPPGQAPAAR